MPFGKIRPMDESIEPHIDRDPKAERLTAIQGELREIQKRLEEAQKMITPNETTRVAKDKRIKSLNDKRAALLAEKGELESQA